jgi:hypothetical protein
MTDKQFQVAIDDTIRALREYRKLLMVAELEYESRFGSNPSEWDDDYWIDSMHYNPMSMTVKQVTDSALLHKMLEKGQP